MLDGTLNVTGLSGFGAGVYRLFNYAGSLIRGGLAIGALPGGYSAFVDTSTPNETNLSVSVVPEPSTLALAVGALAIVTGVRMARTRRDRVEKGV